MTSSRWRLWSHSPHSLSAMSMDWDLSILSSPFDHSYKAHFSSPYLFIVDKSLSARMKCDCHSPSERSWPLQNIQQSAWSLFALWRIIWTDSMQHKPKGASMSCSLSMKREWDEWRLILWLKMKEMMRKSDVHNGIFVIRWIERSSKTFSMRIWDGSRVFSRPESSRFDCCSWRVPFMSIWLVWNSVWIKSCLVIFDHQLVYSIHLRELNSFREEAIGHIQSSFEQREPYWPRSSAILGMASLSNKKVLKKLASNWWEWTKISQSWCCFALPIPCGLRYTDFLTSRSFVNFSIGIFLDDRLRRTVLAAESSRPSVLKENISLQQRK